MIINGYSTDGMDIAKSDPMLLEHSEHLKYRYRQFLERKAAIEEVEGSLASFASGYKRFGFNTEGAELVYREWAPAAEELQLIGEFNDWNGEGHKAVKDDFGVWELRMPVGAVPHGSKVKVRMKGSGWTDYVDRIPAWIKWATVEPGVMGAKYDGIHWDPPSLERHHFKNSKPPRASAPRIYEAHVGMSGPEERVTTYAEFTELVLPRVKKLGYNTIQLMAVQEHAYYASFGYHVTNPFAVSSRSGNPEDLKALVDAAHGMGIAVLIDVVHSHASSNAEDGLPGFDFGQHESSNYFHQGERGYHTHWDSRLYNYEGWEVQRYLLSNLRYWMEEFQFDGFRFDGVTSMLYHHHGINVGFSGNYHEYFSESTDVDAVVYMMLANDLVHALDPNVITIAEDVSGMPALGRPVAEGGVGFDYRLSMAIPDKWIELIKHVTDEDWKMSDIVTALCNRRYSEKCIAYAESHDQALVGDKTLAFRLMDAEMYTGMSALAELTPVIERGFALHKMIRMVTMAIGGDGYLNFMGNEFGHPEWIDFPREGNDWSYAHCRRQFELADTDHLRYKFLQAWDEAMHALDKKHNFLASPHQMVTTIDDENQILVAERGPLVFVFNFSPSAGQEEVKVGAGWPGKYVVALDSDAWDFMGAGRVPHAVEYFTTPEEPPYHDRTCSFVVSAPPRTVVVYERVIEDNEHAASDDSLEARK